eukprot:scaffold37838_cov263-Skeletonema_marinoi.AAC.1
MDSYLQRLTCMSPVKEILDAGRVNTPAHLSSPMLLASKSSSSSKWSKPYSYTDTSSWILHSETVLRVTCSSEDTQWTVNSLGLVASAHLFLSSASTSLLSFIAATKR